jgi:hypothetical protein
MTTKTAIAIIENMSNSMTQSIAYRANNGENIKIEEYMFPEALEIVLIQAKKNIRIGAVNKILDGDRSEK